MDQADWLDLKVGGHWRCFCIHRVNLVKSRSALSTITVPYSQGFIYLCIYLFIYFLITSQPVPKRGSAARRRSL